VLDNNDHEAWFALAISLQYTYNNIAMELQYMRRKKMNKELLLQVIKDQRKALLIENRVKREKLDDIERYKKTKQIIVVSGLRRCGKSTLLEQVRNSEKQRDYYMIFDDDRLIDFQVADFQMMFEVFIEQFGEQDIFYFEEIQKIKGWERFVRRLYDNGKKVYVTGSNACCIMFMN
jgi:predicted AAA+ superfamily ATPase